MVQQALARTDVENVDELRELEQARLDPPAAAHWDKSCAGMASTLVILKVIQRRIRRGLSAIFIAMRCQKTSRVL